MPRESSIARRYFVHGRVQGVGFRYFVERAARELDLDGYVKNRADGSVEVYASGPPERLDDLHQQLRAGPSMSRVERVEEHPAEPGGRKGFRVEF